MNYFGIFGTSGMAREAGDIAYELSYKPIYIARDQDELDAWNFPEDVLLEGEISRIEDIPFAIGIGNNQIRERVAKRYTGTIKFANLIHPSATFGRLQKQALSKQYGLIICAGARFTNNIQVDDFCIVNQNVAIAHDVMIEKFVHLAPGSIVSGNVWIEHGAWLGAGAIVNQGHDAEKLRIGQNTVIGSGAVVIKSCEPNATYAGVPAKRIK